jgi:hypothetical protein
MGEDRAHPESGYYVRDDAAPRGRPLNRYRLDYCPLVSYPRLLVRHLLDRAPPAYGVGLELWPLHLARVRALTGGAGPPGWIIGGLPLAGLALAVGGAIGLGRTVSARSAPDPLPGG